MDRAEQLDESISQMEAAAEDDRLDAAEAALAEDKRSELQKKLEPLHHRQADLRKAFAAAKGDKKAQVHRALTAVNLDIRKMRQKALGTGFSQHKT